MNDKDFIFLENLQGLKKSIRSKGTQKRREKNKNRWDMNLGNN